MKKRAAVMFAIAVVLLTACELENTDLNEIIATPLTLKQVENFSWIGLDNKPFTTENAPPGFNCRVYAADLNRDGIQEIILSTIDFPRAIPANEVFISTEEGLVSIGGFMGDIENINLSSLDQAMEIYSDQSGNLKSPIWVESYYGGVERRTLLDLKLDTLEYRPITALLLYESGSFSEKRYYIPDNNINCSRDYLEFEITEVFKEVTEDEYMISIEAYMDSLTWVDNLYFTHIVDYNILNLPDASLISDPEFDLNSYMEHKDDLEEVEKINKAVAETVCSVLINKFHIL